MTNQRVDFSEGISSMKAADKLHRAPLLTATLALLSLSSVFNSAPATAEEWARNGKREASGLVAPSNYQKLRNFENACGKVDWSKVKCNTDADLSFENDPFWAKSLSTMVKPLKYPRNGVKYLRNRRDDSVKEVINFLKGGRNEDSISSEDLENYLITRMKKLKVKHSMSTCQIACLSACATQTAVEYDETVGTYEDSHVETILRRGAAHCQGYSALTAHFITQVSGAVSTAVEGRLNGSDGPQWRARHSWTAVRLENNRWLWLEPQVAGPNGSTNPYSNSAMSCDFQKPELVREE